MLQNQRLNIIEVYFTHIHIKSEETETAWTASFQEVPKPSPEVVKLKLWSQSEVTQRPEDEQPKSKWASSLVHNFDGDICVFGYTFGKCHWCFSTENKRK